MTMVFRVAAVAAGVLLPQVSAAHPHVFIDTGLEVFLDDEGRVAAVRVAWVYDDFYSLTMLSDLGLDLDGDGKLTPDEEAKLSGFDMAWDADYQGDLYVQDGAAPVALGRPFDWTARVSGGRIISTHLRKLEVPVVMGAEPLVLQVYDPGYYTAYTILGVPTISGAAADRCTVQVYEPDTSAAQEELLAMLQEYTADQSVEAEYPAVGASFADEARVTCVAR